MSHVANPKPGSKSERTLLSRFWAKVDKSGECWTWTAGTTTRGYGWIRTGESTYQTAHRLSWEWANGQAIPDGLLVLHSCDVRRCVRPEHLRIGTVAENSHDMVDRGRGRGGDGHWGTSMRAKRMLLATAETAACDIEQFLSGREIDLAQTLASLREAISKARVRKADDRV